MTPPPPRALQSARPDGENPALYQTTNSFHQSVCSAVVLARVRNRLPSSGVVPVPPPRSPCCRTKANHSITRKTTNAPSDKFRSWFPRDGTQQRKGRAIRLLKYLDEIVPESPFSLWAPPYSFEALPVELFQFLGQNWAEKAQTIEPSNEVSIEHPHGFWGTRL